MRKSLRTLALSLGFIAVLPLAGLLISGRSLKPYLEFPPITRYIDQAPFSWPAFILYALLISLLIAPFLFQFLGTSRNPLGKSFGKAKKFPWWGYLGIFLGLLAWIMAWNRFPGLKPYQAHSFTPLWLAYILVINALTYQRTGHCPKLLAWLALVIAGSGLCLLGLFPHYLFSLLWVSPLIIIVALQALFDEKQVFSNITRGDWTLIVVSTSAALVCGFFWEMWNFYSLAKWKYQIPFVQRFSLFEMPLFGYAGYLPFGLECSLIADLVLNGSIQGKK